MSILILSGHLFRAHGREAWRWFLELCRWTLANPERKRAFRIGAIAGCLASVVIFLFGILAKAL